MAKRKRLSPANPGYLGTATGEQSDGLGALGSGMEARRPAAPIAMATADSATSAALSELSETLASARSEGRMVLPLPLAQIRLDHLVRDRVSVDDEDMAALVESLRSRGQQTPIEVVSLGPDSYGLISGWRRCQALQLLHEATGEACFATVLALLRRPEEASEAYLAMVEENEIRVGLSYYERARIVAKAAAQGVFTDEREGLRALFAHASRAKRSKIGSFLSIVHGLDGALRFPRAIGERTGLKLAQALEADTGLAARLSAVLAEAAPADADAEQALLLQHAAGERMSSLKSTGPAKRPRPEIREPRPGLKMTAHEDGRIVLSGEGLTPELRDALVTWLAQQG